MTLPDPRRAAPAPALRLSVVIPAFNEEGAIRTVLDRIVALSGALGAEGLAVPEIIVVDDGSHDRTAELARGIDGVRVIAHDGNRGYGAALKTGMGAARGDLIAFLDADGTYPPEALPELCRSALAGADLVVGSRMNGNGAGMPLARRLGNRAFARLVTLLGDTPVADCASGMRVVRRAVLASLEPLPDGLHFTPVMSLRALHEGLAVVEVPIDYAERIGSSKLSVLRDGFQYLRSIVWTTLGYNPVRVLGAVGLAGVLLAALIGIALVVARLSGVTTLGPAGVAAVFVALVAGVGGVSLFGLGATFNYLLSLLRKQPIRMGIFGKPLLARPLERHFGWTGALIASAGAGVAAVALGLGAYGWPIARLWLYLVGSALLLLVGLQLVVSWVLMSVLHDVSERQLRNGEKKGEHGP